MEANIAKKVRSAIESKIEEIGFILDDVELKGEVLRIVVDSENGINLDDCARISHEIDPIIDTLEGLPEKFNMEVSSPGIDKLLKTVRDFKMRVNNNLTIILDRELKKGEYEDSPVMEKRCKGQKHFVGKLQAANENGIIEVKIDKGLVFIPISAIKKAQVEIDFGNKKIKNRGV